VASPSGRVEALFVVAHVTRRWAMMSSGPLSTSISRTVVLPVKSFWPSLMVLRIWPSS